MEFSSNSKNVTFANIKWDKENKRIYFLITKDKVQSEQTKFTGKLYEVKLKAWQYENKPKESVQFIFKEGTDEVWIESGWSNVTKGILNTLDGANAIGNVMISLYTNKKGYASAFVEVDGNEVSWKYKLEELPQVQKVKVRGEEITDDLEQIEFFRSTIIPSINKKIKDEVLVETEFVKATDPHDYFKPSGKGKQEVISGVTIPDNKEIVDDLPFISPYYRRFIPMLNRVKHSLKRTETGQILTIYNF